MADPNLQQSRIKFLPRTFRKDFDIMQIKAQKQDFLYKALLTWPTNPGKALLRANEARLMSKFIHTHPSLDVGCGDGALVSILDYKLDFGLDISYQQTKLSHKSNNYRFVLNSDALEVPFASNYFSTVISNSTLEHVNEVDKILREVYRILQPQGQFAITVPSPQKKEYLYYSKWKNYSDTAVGEHYERYFDEFWIHKNYLEPEQWKNKLIDAGFKNVIKQYYEPPDVSKLIDLLRSIEIKYTEWKNFDLSGNFVQEAWIELLYNQLKPYYEMPAEEKGGGVFLYTTK